MTPLIVFSDDWGRHPSSCQHLISRLLPRRQVIWVNTIGTRPPRLNWATFTRAFEKLRHWTRPAGGPSVNPHSSSLQVEGNLRVLNPKMWPSFRSSLARAINCRLLTRSLRPVADSGTQPPIIITTLPLLADLVGKLRAVRWVYYCVDNFSVWPGLDGRTMRKMEAELLARVDVAIAVSENLQAHLANLGKPAHLLTHGVDLEFWRRAPAAKEPPAWLRELEKIARPLIVFWGVIDRRLDVPFVQKLGETLTEGTLLFVGPQDNPDPGLFQVPRIRFFPALPYEDLSVLAAQASLFIAPYADLPVTRAMQPLKLKEYMATGKPVVVRRLPATETWSDCADVADSVTGFAESVRVRLAEGISPQQQLARKRLETEGWDAKARQFEMWIDGG